MFRLKGNDLPVWQPAPVPHGAQPDPETDDPVKSNVWLNTMTRGLESPR
jgi:hypothetical protein